MPTERSLILHSGRLSQQYVVEEYIKIEMGRLEFYRDEQEKILAELYQDIIDSVVTGESRGSKVGKRIILPAKFFGGPGVMQRRYLHAMALVQKFGKPIFS